MGGGASIISQDRLEVFDSKIRALQIPKFPDLTPRRLAIPAALTPKPLSTAPKRSRCDAAAILMVVATILCLLSPISGYLMATGIAGLVAGGGFLLGNKEAQGRRKHVADLTQRLAQIQGRLARQAQAIMAGYRKLNDQFENAVAEFNLECAHYRADKDNLEDVLVFQRAGQKNQFLAQHSIQDNMAGIHGLTTSMVSMLQSFGVDSALDINKLNLSAIPNMSTGLTMELLRWREQIEASFVHKPEHGVTFSDAKSASDAAVRRFKASQARRVLTGAKQLQALVDVARYELQRALGVFDDMASRGHDIAVKLRDYQSGRRPLERLLNHSLATILGPVIGVPLYCLVVYLLFG
jgi:DNA-binding helix-hairpin-helix protein with protein kinase domain